MQHFRTIGEGTYWSKDDFLNLKNQKKIDREREREKKKLPFLREEREALEKELEKEKEEMKSKADEVVPVTSQDDANETRYKTCIDCFINILIYFLFLSPFLSIFPLFPLSSFF